MLNSRAIFRLFDGWWPRRQASRLSHSCRSKAGLFVFFISLFFLPPCFYFFMVYLQAELLVTGMLCHSKVWSRVWRHRCNVNIYSYISVCPSARFLSFLLLFLICLSFCLPNIFLSGCALIPGFSTGTFEGRLCHPVELSDLICRDLLLSCHLIIFFVRLLLFLFFLFDYSALCIFDHSTT